MNAARVGWLDAAAGMAAIAAGSMWALAAWRWYASGGTGHPGRLAGGAEVLFAAALLCMGLVLSVLAASRRGGGGWPTTGAVLAAGGAAIAALGNVVLSCDPMILEFLGRRGTDCGLAGAIVSGLGRVLLDAGLFAFGIGVVRHRSLGRASLLPLLIVVTSVVTPVVGELGSRVGGSFLARVGELCARLAHAAGWMWLGWVLSRGAAGSVPWLRRP